jgi:17beta-estradiol 17-dehydrogenase / very-long-chain 3-oxoacyl-CoA reductase
MLGVLSGDSLLASALAAIGALALASISLKTVSSIYKTFLRPAKNLKKLGKWVVITGATDGIGKAYAMALAKKGMSIVLISRTESKLKDVEKEIKDKGYSGVETKYVVCDYSNFDKKAQETVAAAIKDLDIGILINNVGVSYPYTKFFHELTDGEVFNLMEMNISSTTWMTRMVLPGMIERKRGSIVNIASAAGLYTMPLLAQYSAAKAYIEKFSRGLNAEYAGKNITVQCQAPFFVATKLAKLRKSFTVPTPDAFVAMGMKWIAQGEAVASPFWFHALQGYIMSSLPSGFVDKQVMGIHMAIRKKGMKKDAAKKE